MVKHDVSIIIPCYNEEENIKRGVLIEIDSYLSQQNIFNYEVVLVNDESTDHSKQLCEKYIKTNSKFSLIDIPHGGKPSAVWAGIKNARYKWVLFTDMDQSTPLIEIEKLLNYLEKYSVVIGSRGKTREGQTILRILMSKVFTLFRRSILLSDIHDTQCGFKIFDTNLAKRLFPSLGYFQKISDKGWRVSAFDVELLFMAEKCGYKIKEVPVKWHNEDTSNTKGDDLIRFKKESQVMLHEIIRVKLNDLKGKYEKI